MKIAIGVLFWAIASPLILYGLLYVVSETVEHFTP